MTTDGFAPPAGFAPLSPMQLKLFLFYEVRNRAYLEHIFRDVSYTSSSTQSTKNMDPMGTEYVSFTMKSKFYL